MPGGLAASARSTTTTDLPLRNARDVDIRNALLVNHIQIEIMGINGNQRQEEIDSRKETYKEEIRTREKRDAEGKREAGYLGIEMGSVEVSLV